MMICMKGLGVEVSPKYSRNRKEPAAVGSAVVRGKGEVAGGMSKDCRSLPGHFQKKLVWSLGWKSDLGICVC